MRLSDIGEFGLIRSLQRTTHPKSSGTIIGIGDDAALLQVPASMQLLATTDALIEGVHFDLSFSDHYSLGWKTAAANLSDIAAMGGVPRFCLLALAAPGTTPVRSLRELYRGLRAQLTAERTDLVGGNTSASPDGIMITVTILGQIEKGRAVTRSGAKIGDRIFVTGTLGDSAAGLELLKKGVRVRSSFGRVLVRRHLRPEPRIAWGRALASGRIASAMIDISDGLASDLGHICRQSGVGAVLFEERIPLSAPLLGLHQGLGRSPVQYALTGGEDYELLFTVPPAKLSLMRSAKFPATEIGVVTGGRVVMLEDRTGRTRRLQPTGFDHFKGRE